MNSEKRIFLVKGDITLLEVDAIVNAANSSLLGDGGVDRAIHKSSGTELLNECKKLNGCPTGNAKITKGYDLPANWVIHTVGPIWQGGTANEDAMLKDCYMNSLSLAVENKIESIAFPAISTGVYNFPLERATKIAVSTVKFFLKTNISIKRVVFVCFGTKAYETYKNNI
ncbi:MAG: O-acetyl-ADP-ribose deacetylase [Candidatus Theseobacter exili]|nr:O-acetyl-ADP-ribose deacetylase [Candidatus Theseobacter exili]